MLDILQNDSSYISGSELTLPPQESLTFTIMLTTMVTSANLTIENITFGLVLEGATSL